MGMNLLSSFLVFVFLFCVYPCSSKPVRPIYTFPLAYGYNVLTETPTLPLFNFHYSKSQKLSIRGQTWDVPDEVRATPREDVPFDSAAVSYFSWYEMYNRELYKFANKESKRTSSCGKCLQPTRDILEQLFNKNQLYVTWRQLCFSLYGLGLYRGLPLAADFQTAIDDLPYTFEPEDKEAFFSLFRKYGTHYYYSLDFGGQMDMFVAINKTIVQEKDLNDSFLWLEEQSNIALRDLSRELNVPPPYDPTRSTTPADPYFKANSNVTASLRGGEFPLNSGQLLQSSKEFEKFFTWKPTLSNSTKWLESVLQNPAMSSKFAVILPISDLIMEDNKKAVIVTALNEYLEVPPDAPSSESLSS
eukprot:GILI01008229.1.p1 GENE.GILI01008229.1~~GILI01008229.1.p1  ORF type:complete len:359 (+),score=89.11 GILI01008229.1:61-1137(+)